MEKDLVYIKEEYEKLINLDANSDGADRRRRGFDFERLLNRLFNLEQLEPRTGYRPLGVLSENKIVD